MNDQTPTSAPTVTADRTGLEVVDDLDQLVESLKCSCSGGDDNPN